ncbi:MAG: phosphonate ABC transporter, permease protein PhnE [Bacillota bacterium]
MKGRRVLGYVGFVLFLVTVWWSTTGLDINWERVMTGLPGAAAIVNLMFPPNWGYAGDVGGRLIETIHIAIVGTSIGAILAIPFGFLAAINVSRSRLMVGFGKSLLNAIRTFPELLLAIVIMRGVGPGAFAGVLAMGVHSIGMLGKLYAEVVEGIDPGPVEALQSTGANRIQTIWYGIIPQVLPDFASYALYRLEINIRAASVLGLVGAGGIGIPLLFNLRARIWDKVGMILLGIIVVVTIVDYGSAYLRKRIV